MEAVSSPSEVGVEVCRESGLAGRVELLPGEGSAIEGMGSAILVAEVDG